MIFLVWILLIGAHIIDAYSDAYQDRLKKRTHLGEIISVILFISSGLLFDPIIMKSSIALIYKILIIIGAFSLSRLGVFNLAYNKFRKLDYGYIGSTSLVDKYIDKISNYAKEFSKKNWKSFNFLKNFISGLLNFVPIVIYGISFFFSLILLLLV